MINLCLLHTCLVPSFPPPPAFGYNVWLKGWGGCWLLHTFIVLAEPRRSYGCSGGGWFQPKGARAYSHLRAVLSRVQRIRECRSNRLGYWHHMKKLPKYLLIFPQRGAASTMMGSWRVWTGTTSTLVVASPVRTTMLHAVSLAAPRGNTAASTTLITPTLLTTSIWQNRLPMSDFLSLISRVY